MDTIIKTFEYKGKYYMILKDPKRTEFQIGYSEYESINYMNERITKKYKQ
jgi:hypothetical protein